MIFSIQARLRILHLHRYSILAPGEGNLFRCDKHNRIVFLFFSLYTIDTRQNLKFANFLCLNNCEERRWIIPCHGVRSGHYEATHARLEEFVHWLITVGLLFNENLL
jgi:hypothetical protein